MKIKKINHNNFDLFYSLLEKDFCFEERKTKQDQFNSLSKKQFNPHFIYKDNNIIGYFCWWDFDDFVFGEHFAILPEIRNRGLGSEFLKDFLSKQTKPFVFEVERPHNKNSQRRLSFYKRNGIIINGYDYYQPSYHNAKDNVPMFIASYPSPISYEEYLFYSKIIKDVVYN